MVNIEKVKDLSAGASRLMAVLIMLGDKAAATPTKELMELAGIPDRGNFSRARKSLIEIGFIAATHQGSGLRVNQE